MAKRRPIVVGMILLGLVTVATALVADWSSVFRGLYEDLVYSREPAPLYVGDTTLSGYKGVLLNKQYSWLSGPDQIAVFLDRRGNEVVRVWIEHRAGGSQVMRHYIISPNVEVRERDRLFRDLAGPHSTVKVGT